MFISARFTVGWYISRIFSIATSTIVLAVLLEETIVLYGRLARSNAMLLRERNNGLMSLEALTAAIKHELKQPLGAMILNGEALELFLRKVPPDLDEARSVASDMITGSHRISKTLDAIGNLFGSAKQELTRVNMNDLARQA